MSRRKFRENCFKILFCSYFHDEQELYEQVGLFMENEENDYLKAENTENKEADQIDEIYSRAKAVREEMESIDETISLVSRGWTLDRMGKVELTILRLAVYEMKYDEKIPEKVAVNEAVELAKKFGGDDSFSFVNGILAKLM
jgi:transcription antitermination factor nusB